MSININKQQVDIENLKKQNEFDFDGIEELYRRLNELREKITQIKYINSTLVKKLEKDYESLKRVIIDENVSVQLSNKIDETKTSLNTRIDNVTDEINTQLYSIINLDTINFKKSIGGF